MGWYSSIVLAYSDLMNGAIEELAGSLDGSSWKVLLEEIVIVSEL